MDDIQPLRDKFEIPGAARIDRGHGDLPRIVISGQSSSGEIYLNGAHVTHFQPRDSQPILFMSRSSLYQPGKPIRGGIPIIFPWFGPRQSDPTSPAHGFARLRPWEIESIDRLEDGAIRASLQLAGDTSTFATWHANFLLRATFVFSSRLDVTIQTQNTGNTPFDFEIALHSYFLLGDARRATVAGLAGAQYIDKTDHFATKTQTDPLVRFQAETDRVYPRTHAACALHDPSMNRTITVEKNGSASTVVWNPWIDKARAMPDFGDDEWTQMACVETANVGDDRITLAPGASHEMHARIAVK